MGNCCQSQKYQMNQGPDSSLSKKIEPEPKEDDQTETLAQSNLMNNIHMKSFVGTGLDFKSVGKSQILGKNPIAQKPEETSIDLGHFSKDIATLFRKLEIEWKSRI